MRRAGAFCLLLGVLLAASPSARADQDKECAPRTAADLAWMRDDMRRFEAKTLAAERSKEAEKIGGNPEVLRVEDRLFLALDGDRVASLTDCRFGDSLKMHFYESYDTAGGFYVVATHEYEDFAYTLVMKWTGKRFRSASHPVWSPEAKAFVHGRCDMMNDYNIVQIVNPNLGDFRIAATVALPCQGRRCEFSWDSATSLSIVCRSASQPPVAEASFKLVLKDGAWTVVR
jgi:hypothetical protein